MSKKEFLIISFNVDGFRDEIFEYVKNFLNETNVHVLCLNETKKSEEKLRAYFDQLSNYSYICNVHRPANYHGVAILVRKDISFAEIKFSMDCESRYDTKSPDPMCGRVIAIQIEGKFNILCAYTPNSGTDWKNPLKNLGYRINTWDKAWFNVLRRFEAWVPTPTDNSSTSMASNPSSGSSTSSTPNSNSLARVSSDNIPSNASSSNTITGTMWIGDINVSPVDIDVSHPSSLRGHAGFTDEERNSFKSFLSENKWVDIYRLQHPTERGYSFRGYNSYRYRWRLDNCLVTTPMVPFVKDSFILSGCTALTDHVPIGVTLLY